MVFSLNASLDLKKKNAKIVLRLGKDEDFSSWDGSARLRVPVLGP